MWWKGNWCTHLRIWRARSWLSSLKQQKRGCSQRSKCLPKIGRRSCRPNGNATRVLDILCTSSDPASTFNLPGPCPESRPLWTASTRLQDRTGQWKVPARNSKGRGRGWAIYFSISLPTGWKSMDAQVKPVALAGQASPVDISLTRLSPLQTLVP